MGIIKKLKILNKNKYRIDNDLDQLNNLYIPNGNKHKSKKKDRK
jgi:hypothetical protein